MEPNPKDLASPSQQKKATDEKQQQQQVETRGSSSSSSTSSGIAVLEQPSNKEAPSSAAKEANDKPKKNNIVVIPSSLEHAEDKTRNDTEENDETAPSFTPANLARQAPVHQVRTVPGAFFVPGINSADISAQVSVGVTHDVEAPVTEEAEGLTSEPVITLSARPVDEALEKERLHRLGQQESELREKEHKIRHLEQQQKRRCRRMLIVLVVGLTVVVIAIAVSLTAPLDEDSPPPAAVNIPVDDLVSSINVTAKQRDWFARAYRYRRTENENEIFVSDGRTAITDCEVLACIEGGCTGDSGKEYEPGCCHGDDCNQNDTCGFYCPKAACHPSSDGCKDDASCFECDLGPNGEELYRFRDAVFDLNCLRTGLATGFNDNDDSIVRRYKWAIYCGFNIHGGSEWQNYAPGEYACFAVRVGGGIRKTLFQPLNCQLIQLLECGCGPDTMHTFGNPPPEKPCKTKQDCPFLCGDAGEEEAKKLCEVFPGIEWWEGENPWNQSLAFDPEEELIGPATIQIDIYEE